MTLFFLTFVLTNIVFSLLAASVLVVWNGQKRYSDGELLLYALGLGPAFTTLLLYYFLLLIPSRSNSLYFIVVCAAYGLIALIGRRGAVRLWKDARGSIRYRINRFRAQPVRRRVLGAGIAASSIIILTVLFCLLFRMISRAPLDGHDILGYGVMGKIFFAERSINPFWHSVHTPTGFIFESLHAPSFPLLLTWEKFLTAMFGVDSDLYFRSISAWYVLLILALQFCWFSKVSKGLALFGVVALASSPLFFVNLVSYHLDSFRIFLLIVSWIWLAYAIRNNDPLSLVLFGICSGLAGFAHSIGVIIAGINCLALFLFLKDSWIKRIGKTLFALGLVMVCGGLHYVIGTFWGRGWIW